jgi:proteasome lid subunit RPN8/RPN11
MATQTGSAMLRMTTDEPQDSPSGPDASTVYATEWPIRPIGGIKGTRLAQYQAVVRRVALDAIHGHGKSITASEVCGVLVGNVYRDEKGPYLYISSAIRGDRASGLATQVTFTAETWSHIQAVMDNDHPDERIVGWYHTHPGFGIFLSGMDLFIQDHFFNLPWQVALVYDPISGDEGMFFWRDGKADRQPYLIEEEDTREHATTFAEMQAAEAISKNPAAHPIQEQTSVVPPIPTESGWSYEQSKRRHIMPTWLIGAIAFAISFGCTLWAMYSINQEMIIPPQHFDHPTTLQPSPAQGDK